MGGEKLYCIAAFCSMWGSPPRGRGKADVLFSQFFARRITPAWAGKSPRFQRQCIPRGDHPRMGGEKLLFSTYKKAPRGSPPHGRGKAVGGLSWPCGAWITPAWAGKSCSFQRIKKPPGDHPRMGGEKYTGKGEKGEAAGSPPRWRGKVRASRLAVGDGGITPAWAGKSSTAQPRSMKKWDHPRTGGEKLSLTLY